MNARQIALALTLTLCSFAAAAAKLLRQCANNFPCGIFVFHVVSRNADQLCFVVNDARKQPYALFTERIAKLVAECFQLVNMRHFDLLCNNPQAASIHVLCVCEEALYLSRRPPFDLTGGAGPWAG